MKPAYRTALRLAVLCVAIAVFARYLYAHPDLARQLLRTSPVVIASLLAMYTLWFAALALTVHATLLLCRRHLPVREQVLLNAYSTLVNFFVPGQGGVAVRGLYLKRNHGLGVKTYVLGCLCYYAAYALLSTLMLLAPSLPWWQTISAMLLVAAGCFAIISFYIKRSPASGRGLDIRLSRLALLVATTLLQGLVQIALYFFELRSVAPGTSLMQAATYTGAANLSLFVALTPGGIGVRESFLLFSKRLHHVGADTIVAASLLDRASFLLLLGLLALLTVALHARAAVRLDSHE
jgi:uncharacterized membrane protein YbhN (UPF0104 family)